MIPMDAAHDGLIVICFGKNGIALEYFLCFQIGTFSLGLTQMENGAPELERSVQRHLFLQFVVRTVIVQPIRRNKRLLFLTLDLFGLSELEQLFPNV